jgi:hypothetical protein
MLGDLVSSCHVLYDNLQSHVHPACQQKGGPSDEQATSVTGTPVQNVYVALFDLVCILYKCSIFTVSGKMWFVM